MFSFMILEEILKPVFKSNEKSFHFFYPVLFMLQLYFFSFLQLLIPFHLFEDKNILKNAKSKKSITSRIIELIECFVAL